jgi:hypothetical protein
MSNRIGAVILTTATAPCVVSRRRGHGRHDDGHHQNDRHHDDRHHLR